MQVAMVGLGRMGMNMARRLVRGGHEVVAYNRTPEKTEALAAEGARAAYSLEEAAASLVPPRAVWLMLPAGRVVDEHVERLLTILSPGDILLDGGRWTTKNQSAPSMQGWLGGLISSTQRPTMEQVTVNGS